MATRATLEARLVTKQDQLDAANETYIKLLTKLNKSYGFESASDGEQSATKQSMTELRKQIEWLEGEIGKIERELAGGGVVQMHSTRYQ